MYYGDRGSEVAVLKEKSRLPILERWKHWGENAATSFDLPIYEGDLNLMNDVEVSCMVDQTEISWPQVQGVLEESSLYWTTLLNNQDYQPNDLSGKNEKFMNSLLEDDVHDSEHFPLYGLARSHGSYSMGNNLTNDMSSYEDLNLEDFPYSLHWEKKQSDSPQCITLVGNVKAPQQVCDQPSVEETVLHEFGTAMQKMTDESRLCFRDALYRLASNSENQLSNQRQYGDKLPPSGKLFTTALTDHMLGSTADEVCKSRTNTIDRAVADLMFNKAYRNYNSHPELALTTKAHCGNNLKNSLAPHFQHFTGSTPEDAVVPTYGQAEAQYSEY